MHEVKKNEAEWLMYCTSEMYHKDSLKITKPEQKM
jgi:hypothetical protein